jgi:hypothetical protein
MIIGAIFIVITPTDDDRHDDDDVEGRTKADAVDDRSDMEDNIIENFILIIY